MTERLYYHDAHLVSFDATVRAYATPPDAWQAAFELFRNHAVV